MTTSKRKLFVDLMASFIDDISMDTLSKQEFCEFLTEDDSESNISETTIPHVDMKQSVGAEMDPAAGKRKHEHDGESMYQKKLCLDISSMDSASTATLDEYFADLPLTPRRPVSGSDVCKMLSFDNYSEPEYSANATFPMTRPYRDPPSYEEAICRDPRGGVMMTEAGNPETPGRSIFCGGDNARKRKFSVYEEGVYQQNVDPMQQGWSSGYESFAETQTRGAWSHEGASAHETVVLPTPWSPIFWNGN